MPKKLLLFLLLLALGKTSAQTLQLAPPQTPNTRLFASPGLKIDFDFRLADAEIRYTTDSTEPTAGSSIFTSPFEVNGPATLKAKSFKAGFLPSETTTVQVLPYHSHKIDSIGMNPVPGKYPANGWKTLCDRQLGDNNFNQNWVGTEAREFELVLYFSKKQRVSNIAVGLLRQQKSWVFLPTAIEVYDEKRKLLARQALPDEAADLPNSMEIISLKTPGHRYKSLKIKLVALSSIPAWHPGAGNGGWIFLDEIMAW